MQNTQAKDDAMAALDGEFSSLFAEWQSDDDDILDVFNDPAGCVGCAE